MHTLWKLWLAGFFSVGAAPADDYLALVNRFLGNAVVQGDAAAMDVLRGEQTNLQAFKTNSCGQAANQAKSQCTLLCSAPPCTLQKVAPVTDNYKTKSATDSAMKPKDVLSCLPGGECKANGARPPIQAQNTGNNSHTNNSQTNNSQTNNSQTTNSQTDNPASSGRADQLMSRVNALVRTGNLTQTVKNQLLSERQKLQQWNDENCESDANKSACKALCSDANCTADKIAQVSAAISDFQGSNASSPLDSDSHIAQRCMEFVCELFDAKKQVLADFINNATDDSVKAKLEQDQAQLLAWNGTVPEPPTTTFLELRKSRKRLSALEAIRDADTFADLPDDLKQKVIADIAGAQQATSPPAPGPPGPAPNDSGYYHWSWYAGNEL